MTRNHIKAGLIAAAICTVAIGYTKLVWLSGFDQGSDVALCVVASVQNDGKLAKDDDSCKRADEYRSNPLWLLRRNNHLAEDR